MQVGSDSAPSKQGNSEPDLGRRGFVSGFVKTTGKALYLAPTLTLLGSVSANAGLPSGPPDPPTSAPAAPTAPSPTE